MKFKNEMNQYIANLSVLNVKLHNLHWNVVGEQFMPIHQFTEGLYDVYFKLFDDVAEMLKIRGEYPAASLKTYLEIAESGGGIWSTVTQTRAKTADELKDITLERAEILAKKGTTTAEVKSGYALSVEGEIAMLEGINLANQECEIDLIPTFLGAHMKAKDFEGSNQAYLEILVNEVFPIIKEKKLTNRIDIFIEQSTFKCIP